MAKSKLSYGQRSRKLSFQEKIENARNLSPVKPGAGWKKVVAAGGHFDDDIRIYKDKSGQNYFSALGHKWKKIGSQKAMELTMMVLVLEMADPTKAGKYPGLLAGAKSQARPKKNR